MTLFARKNNDHEATADSSLQEWLALPARDRLALRMQYGDEAQKEYSRRLSAAAVYEIVADGGEKTVRVGLRGCTLKCGVCTAPECRGEIYEPDGVTPAEGVMLLTPEELVQEIARALPDTQTVCFTGGDLAGHTAFISHFREVSPAHWKIHIRTSPAVTPDILRKLAAVADRWIIDIKSLDAEVFGKFTGRKVRVRHLLEMMLHDIGASRISLLVPVIQGFVPREVADDSVQQLRQMGFTDVALKHYTPQLGDTELTVTDPLIASTSPLPPAGSALYFECDVAGILYHQADEIAGMLCPGALLQLVREPANIHDPNAIRVVWRDPDDPDYTVMTGYIPRMATQPLALLLDQGYGPCFVTQVKEFTNRLTISIYLLPHQPENS